MEYSIQKLATLAGISTRTLHYYDEIGLLRPARIKNNGYRMYTQKDLLLLQQILFFRELGFPLEKIQQIVLSPAFNVLKALDDHKKWLTLQKERYEMLLETIDMTIQRLKGGEYMNDDSLFGGLSKKQMEEYQKEAEERWGHTDAWKKSQEVTKQWTEADYDTIAKKQSALTERIAAAFKKKLIPEHEAVQAMMHEHYEGLKQFYEPNYAMYIGLSKMYVDDQRFTAFYDKYAVGLAVFMQQAMQIYAETHLKR